MPRGGKRPGAGAPKGNFNHLQRGNDSVRLRMVYLALLAYPDKRTLILDLRRAGFRWPHSYGRPNHRRLFALLHHYFFIDKDEALALHSLKPAKPPPAVPQAPVPPAPAHHPFD